MSATLELSTLDSLLDSAFLLNAEGELLYVNETFAQLCQSTPRRMVKGGKKIFDFLKIDDAFFKLTPFTEVNEPTMYREVSFQLNDGTWGAAQFCMRPLVGDSGPLFLFFLRDVTLEKSLHDKYRAQLGAKEEVILELQNAQGQLKKYSENLEAMVEERTRKLQEATTLQIATLESLGQGFLVFDSEGLCGSYYSKICPTLFGCVPAGQPIWTVLGLESKQSESFQKWLMVVFMDTVPFEDLKGLLPFEELTVGDRNLLFDFHPLRDIEKGIKGIVMVATDITHEVQMKKALDKERLFAEMISQILRHRKQFLSFVKEANRLLSTIASLADLNAKEESNDVSNAIMALHTLKGGAASFGLKTLAEICGHLEDICRDKIHSSQISAAIGESLSQLKRRWSFDKKQINELLKLNLESSERVIEFTESEVLKVCYLFSASPTLQKYGQEYFEKYFCESVQENLQSFQTEAARLSQLLHKKLHPLVISGPSVALPSDIYRPLFQTFIHLVRNSLDHGIEPPEVRTASGKPEYGTLSFETAVDQTGKGSKLTLVFSDDGGGVDIEKLRRSLEAKGFDLTQKSDQEVLLYLFSDGISTRTEVTEISGRGVGLSAVAEEIYKLGGTFEVESEHGRGFRFILQVPLLNSLALYKRSEGASEAA